MLCVRRENVHHFNWIEFTVKLREEDAQMSLSSEDLLKEGCLVSKILLLAEKAGHAAAFILDQANGGALGPQPSHVEATFFKCLLQPLRFTVFESHLLQQSTIAWVRVADRYHCILLFPLLPTIGFVHVKSA